MKKIDHDDFSTSPAEVQIKIINPKPAKDFWYSVTVESHGNYTKTAMQLGEIQKLPNSAVNDTRAKHEAESRNLLYSWQPITSGDYKIILHELSQDLVINLRAKTPPLSNPFHIHVKELQGDGTRSHIFNKIKELQPCQTVERIDLFTVFDGDWIGPHLNGGIQGLRNGWYFLPGREMNCKIEYFTSKDLTLIPEEKSIYIFGTSRERGIFLSLVDMLLDTKEKARMHDSEVAKCWGRAFVFKSNLKVFYQDWRSGHFQHLGAVPSVKCHGKIVAVEEEITSNGFKVWDEIFQNRSTWPSVILMCTGDVAGFAGNYNLQQFILNLPPDWRGVLFLTDGEFSALRGGRGDTNDLDSYRQEIRELSMSLNDSRVRWIDGMGISKEMRLYSQYGPNRITGSQHFHRLCNEFYHDENNEKRSIMICSNITELLGQILLGHALGPKNALFAQQTRPQVFYNMENNSVESCHACPRSMLPFHITPHPDMVCESGPLEVKYQSDIKDEVPLSCPEECMQLEISSYIQTQSGRISERLCPLEVFFSKTPAKVENMDPIMLPVTGAVMDIDAKITTVESESSPAALFVDIWIFNIIFVCLLAVAFFCCRPKIRKWKSG